MKIDGMVQRQKIIYLEVFNQITIKRKRKKKYIHNIYDYYLFIIW
jgi:hypothetical protein